MTKSQIMFDGYCETLRQMLDKMSDEEFAKEAKDNEDLLISIGYKRKEKE